nr:O-antigen ligase family protein [Legionella yabuuchiae]
MLTALIICSELLRYSTGQEKINIIFFSRRRILYTVAFFIVNLGLLLSFSRGIYLSYGFSLLFLFIINANRSTLKIILGLSTILLLSLIFLYLTASESIQHRFDMLEHEKSRMIIWKGAWHLWRESAWYGIGIENFKYFYQAFSLPGDGSSLENAHNDYLQLLIETGIPGITIIAALILIFFYYFIRYLRSSNPVSSSRATITTQFAMVSSLAMYSVVDFVFYIFSFNILLGVLLGFFYQHLKDQGCVHPIINITFSYKKNFIVLLAGVFLFITNLFTHLFLYSFYTAQANDYIKHERLPEATKSYHQAKQHFNTPYAYNNLVSLYLEQAKMASDPSGKLNLIDKAERIIAETIALHPYNAEPYFQQGIIYALYYNEIVKAQTAFETFLQLKPHANFERLTFCYFLLEQDQTHYAQSILEKGLLYPIDRYYAPKYLELLANLRLENGDIVGSQKIVEALSDLDNYRLDYSAFAN